MSKYTDESRAVRKARAMLHMSVSALASEAQVNPAFLENLEAGHPATFGPALRNVFAAVARLAAARANELETVATSFRAAARDLEPAEDSDLALAEPASA